MSQKVIKDVKSEGKVIGQVEVEVFDNLDEAEEGLGEEKCIAYINRQHSINLQDDTRRSLTGSTSTGIRDLVKALKADPEAFAQLKEKYGIKASA